MKEMKLKMKTRIKENGGRKYLFYAFMILRTFVNKFILFFVIICSIGIIIYQCITYSEIFRESPFSEKKHFCDRDAQFHRDIVDNYYERRKSWRTSNLGSILFKNIGKDVFIHNSRQNKSYLILVWSYWSWLQQRHINNFGKNNGTDPLQGCSVRNCQFTKHNQDMKIADAVLVHTQKGLYPQSEDRNLNQRWIFLNDESPINKFSLSKNRPSLKNFINIFNWTMTYRSDSDVPVPYGRTIPRATYVLSMSEMDDPKLALEQLVPYWNMKEYEAISSILMSNCVKHRIYFVNELQKHVLVDVYGGCSNIHKNKMGCPGHFRSDCKLINKYIFYLVIENALCRQYLTEKIFFNAYSKGAIPVIMGPPLADCAKLLPPNSYLHVDNYDTPKDLAKHMKEIAHDYEKLLYFHEWRNHFEIVNEHGYFGSRSYHYCRLCEALNYNDGEVSIYHEDDIRLFFDETLTCNKKKLNVKASLP